MNKKIILLGIICILFVSGCSNKEDIEGFKTKSCEELKNNYIHFNFCKGFVSDVCRNEMLFEYLERCLDEKEPIPEIPTEVLMCETFTETIEMESNQELYLYNNVFSNECPIKILSQENKIKKVKIEEIFEYFDYIEGNITVELEKYNSVDNSISYDLVNKEPFTTRITLLKQRGLKMDGFCEPFLCMR